MPSSLDAALLTRWVRAATQALERHRAEMDRINVFPVPDGDTGTNLLLTMRSAAESLRRRTRATAAEADVASPVGEAGSDEPELVSGEPAPTTGDAAADADTAEVAAALAHGAQLGARGNSGVILSQVLRGVSDAAAAVAALSVAAVGAATAGVRDRAAPSGGAVLADALARAARLANAAVSRPQEGTVLSVLASAAGAARAADSDRLDDVAIAAADAAAGALRATTGQLPELAEAGVVDAGGMGVYLVLDALAGVVSGRAAVELPGMGLDCAERPPVPSDLDHRYEVMYLLDVGPDAEIETLRSALALLGDSITLAGAGSGTWTVHVHCQDVGAAIEAGLGTGRPHRIAVSRLPDRTAEDPGADEHQLVAVAGSAVRTASGAADPWAVQAPRIPGPRPSRPERSDGHRPGVDRAGGGDRGEAHPSGTDRTVLIVMAASPVADLARAAGATVFEREPGRAVEPGELVAALAATRARHVVLLPGDAELTAVAEQAASTARGAGQEVLVMPTSSVLQGLSALSVHDPGRRPDDDAVAMAEAAAGTRTAALVVAETEALTWAGRCEPGDVLAISEGEVVLIAPDMAVGALWLAHRMLTAGGELVTVLLGGSADQALADGLVADLRRTHPEIDVVVHRGGATGHPLELGVE